MTSTAIHSLSTMFFVRDKISVYESLDMINEWLKNHPQESSETLLELYKSDKIFIKNKEIFSVPQLSLVEARSLANKIQAEKILEIKDRWYHFKKYRQCFIGSEFVDYLTNVQGKSLEEALAIGRNLLEHNLIHHVCHDHSFKNEFLFYRFKN